MEQEILPPSEVIDGLLADISDDSARKDFETARANLNTLAQEGTRAVETLIGIAEQSQHPNAYLALARMIETVTTTQRELLALQESIRKIAAASASVTGHAKTINNNLFVGSTAQLASLLETLRKKNDETL